MFAAQPKTVALQSQCPLCCALCATEPVVKRSGSPDPSDPYSIHNLLPAGTLLLPISQTDLGGLCNHSHSAEGWHAFLGKDLLPHLTDQENETLWRHLDFLVEHKFLIIQCKIGDSGTALILRVYLIPYDLSGVQGKLRVRNETSDLKPARLCLRNVLPRVMQDESLWDAHDLNSSPSSSHCFLDSSTVVVFSFGFYSEAY
jgi:hypothetical protein